MTALVSGVYKVEYLCRISETCRHVTECRSDANAKQPEKGKCNVLMNDRRPFLLCHFHVVQRLG